MFNIIVHTNYIQMTSGNQQPFLDSDRKPISDLAKDFNTGLAKLLFRFTVTISVTLVYFTASAQIANTLSPADKVFGLSKFWQEVNYNFVYYDKINHQTWDSAYKALLPQVQATQNDYEYYRLLEKFCALLKDGHTEVFMPPIKGVKLIYNMFGDYLLVVRRVNNKVIVIRTWKKDAQKFPLGSEVLEVNGLPTDRYIQDSIAPYISSSTDYVRKEEASNMLLMGPPGSTFTIKLRKPQGEEAVYTLTHAHTKDSIFYPDPGVYQNEKARGVVDWKALPNHIGYVALNTFRSDSKADSIFESLLPALEKCKGIILDLRYNGGGDDGIAFTILRHFIKDSVIVGAASVFRTYNPYLKAIGKYVTVADTVGNPYKQEAWLLNHGYAVYDKPGISYSNIAKSVKRLSAPVVILTGHNTESAAEDFLIATDNQMHIVKIGEPTNGSSGQPYIFELPGGGSARICIKKDMYPDGREFVGKGIQPDIAVTPTVKDYLESKDVVLEAALQYFETKKGRIVKSTNL